ncbi:MAG: phosphocholine cytidylyltransferase family protein [Myxococcales bacterium]|nr:phosphocholine cytidylyltransferase family protein [Myxococcales bacterium]MCB9576479.1 phosphocholine cytidylyltransferase family protein [Polyangiaceae bacterium]
MRAVIIGAGRGSRLGPETREIPKTMVEVMGRPMLEWVLDALAAGGFQKRDVVFICGYAEHVVRERYPEFTFVRNEDWENNNILQSLLCAREFLTQGFVSTYADIVYEPAIVDKLVRSPHDIALGCDTAWRRRYVSRSQHPETDAEKLRADGSRVVEISRRIASETAAGEFIGVAKLTAAGAAELVAAFDAIAADPPPGVWREGRSFQKAYLIDLLQHMLEGGSVMQREDTAGGYMEIDTLEDLALAERWWKERP